MAFEQMPQAETPKTELEKLQAEIAATENEIMAMDPDAPEMDWLKEKLQSLDARLKTMEKPELRTPESYGGKSVPTPEIVEQAEKGLLEMEEKKRKAS